MLGRSLLASAVLGLLTVGATSALADAGRFPHRGGFIPWQSNGFGFGPIYPAGDSTGPQQQAQGYDIAPAVGQAAFAEADFNNRWADLQVLLDRARTDFQISAEYLTAKNDLADAQHAYDAAADSVLARLQTDQQYKDLIEKRTQEQIALKSTGIGTGLRNSMATEKLHTGSMVTQMEAVALTNDSAVQDARTRLVSADETLRLKEKQFESQLYNRPEVAAAREQMEMARANKAGADGYLHGAFIMRADQLNLSAQSNSGNNVFLTGMDPYFRAYYGM
jgi:Tfp pilus assembly protein FimT